MYKIDNRCTNCESCWDVCPVDAIVKPKDKKKELTKINQDCIDCGCCEAVCPHDAISAG